ncbi:MAG: acetoacetate--CoA ligase [Jatrophihabitans sp.]|nr:MAG: acetoacetate--CoA ligase [Jatrophihabitans sp.]
MARESQPESPTDPRPIWVPDPAASSRIEMFRAFVNDRHRLALDDYAGLHRWSVENLDAFWLAIWDFFEIVADGAPTVALADDTMPGTVWFPGVRLNYAEQVLRHPASEKPALIEVTEYGRESAVSWHELRERTAALAATLRDLGVQQGDAVVGYLPNTSVAVIAFLATASLGAIWSACAQDYAAKGAADRFGQLNPAVLFTADGYTHNGTCYDRRAEAEDLIGRLPTLRAVITVDNAGLGAPSTAVRTMTYDEAIANQQRVAPERLPFDTPLWVLFTSGTTGAPKGIVHGHGGVALVHLEQLALQNDIGPDDVFFWYTSTNWMMWNLLLSGLACGATLLLYDGSPLAPTADRLWEVVDKHKVTVFGTSPGHLLASEKAGLHPRSDHDLSQLRSLGSTGATLPVSAFHWVHDNVGAGVQIGSTSGGTDFVSAFVGPAPTVPVWAGEISCVFLGIALEAWDPQGRSVVGEVGELVVSKPIPSMPLYFWNDPDGRRYHDAYFSTYPGVWRHGDWITVTDRGSVIIHGRSDSTLNRHGVRLGSADIYEAVEQLPEIAEALVIGAEEGDGGYWMPLFVVLAPGAELDDALRDRIRTAIRTSASPRHVPDEVIAVRAIPHTRTGKKIEVPVKRLLQGAGADQALAIGAVDDPSLIDMFTEIGRRHRGES